MLAHLLELRRRLFICLGCTLGLAVIFFTQANSLTHLLLQPLLQALPKDSVLIATQVTAPMLIPLQLAVQLALLCATPLFLVQVWGFIGPGLYSNERKLGRLFLGASLCLFMIGVSFCFFLILPWLFTFLMHAAPLGVRVMPDLSDAVGFSLQMLLVFGLCFQLPLVSLACVKGRLLTTTQLKAGRPYAIVSAFIIGMLLTPPDVLSQTMLALPLCGLYELGIVLAGWNRYNSTLRAHSSAG